MPLVLLYKTPRYSCSYYLQNQANDTYISEKSPHYPVVQHDILLSDWFLQRVHNNVEKY